MPPRSLTFTAAILIGSISGLANAATQTTSHNTAVKTQSVTTNASAEGANSFTEAQARERLVKAGYTHVSPLTKDGAGVWRGTALKNKARVNVGLDYKGDISVN